MTSKIIDYALISPAVLISRVERAFDCSCFFHDMGEECFELVVIGCCNLEMLEDILAEYLYNE